MDEEVQEITSFFNENIIIYYSLKTNGVTNRNSFGMTYKGQVVDLINIDNTKWVVTNTSIFQSGTNGGLPAVIFY